MMSVIKEYDLPYVFPKQIEEELKYISDTIDEADIENRVDFRGEPIFTIDGEDAKDLDDAISIEKKENGVFLLGVHIADVSNYVKEGQVCICLIELYQCCQQNYLMEYAV